MEVGSECPSAAPEQLVLIARENEAMHTKATSLAAVGVCLIWS